MQKTYNRINWENYPSDRTPLNETNLNKLDVGVNELDNRIITLDNTKFDKTEASQLIKNFELDKATGIITVTYLSGATATIDTMLEKLAVNFDFDKTSQKLVIVLDDGTVKEIDLTALITEYEFKSTDTVAFSVDADGNVSAIVKDGSIQERHLRPNYLSDIMMESAKAEASAVASDASAMASENSAVRAESFAVGGTNTRTDEDTDNAKFYYEASKQIFNDFENVGAVVGVKGDNESDYRTGFVNITAENVGAAKATDLTSHTNNKNNPHEVTANQVGALLSLRAPIWETPLGEYKTTGVYHIPWNGQTDNPTLTHGTLFVEFDIGAPYQLWIPDYQNIVYKRTYQNSTTWSAWGKMEAGHADSATKATQDGNGNNIPDTYATKGEVLISKTASRWEDPLSTYTTTGVYHIPYGGQTDNPTTTHGTLFVDSTVGTLYQLWISDAGYVMYKRISYNRGTTWESWSKMDAGKADSATNDSNGNKITDTYAKKTDILNTATAIEASTSDDNIVGAKGLKDYVGNIEKVYEVASGETFNANTSQLASMSITRGTLIYVISENDAEYALYSLNYRSPNWDETLINNSSGILSKISLHGDGGGLTITNKTSSEKIFFKFLAKM